MISVLVFETYCPFIEILPHRMRCHKISIDLLSSIVCRDQLSHRQWCIESKQLSLCNNGLFKSYMTQYCCSTCKPTPPPTTTPTVPPTTKPGMNKHKYKFARQQFGYFFLQSLVQNNQKHRYLGGMCGVLHPPTSPIILF